MTSNEAVRGAGRSRHRRAAGALGLLSVLAVAACGGEPAREGSAVGSAIDVAAETPLAQPTDFRAVLQGTTSAVSWAVAPPGTALTGYNFYVDDTDPVSLAATASTFVTGELAPGRDHLLQIVAVAGAGFKNSRPSTATIAVPRPAQPERTHPLQVAPAQSAGTGASAARAPVAQAPVDTVPVAPVPQAASGITVKGAIAASFSIQKLGPGYDDAQPSCDQGWQPALQVLGGAKEVLALADYSAGKLSGVSGENGYVSWDCDWTYNVTAAESAVYTFHAEYENNTHGKSDNRTVSRSSLASGAGPRMYIQLTI